uniref:Uncharacterized protein n=1 Tax=Arundo donax TaxID=35708 RepID=A0A0A8ZC81_ARUDO
MEAIPWKVESPQVSEVSQRRGDGTKKVELGEVQCHRAATTASTQAAHHAMPLAHRDRSVAPRR